METEADFFAQSKSLKFHEISEELPLISEQETKVLAEDIKKNGLLNPIVLFEGQVLDGRNRYNAAKLAKYKFQLGDFVEYDPELHGRDPVMFVIAMNIHRRHLTVGQRSALAAELYKRIAHGKTGPKTEAEDENSGIEDQDSGIED